MVACCVGTDSQTVKLRGHRGVPALVTRGRTSTVTWRTAAICGQNELFDVLMLCYQSTRRVPDGVVLCCAKQRQQACLFLPYQRALDDPYLPFRYGKRLGVLLARSNVRTTRPARWEVGG